MKTHKKFYVIAYDICDDKRRRHVVKKLEALGTRTNYSVFECLITTKQFTTLQEELLKIINPQEDSLAYYPICLNCYAKISYVPVKNKTYNKVVAI